MEDGLIHRFRGHGGRCSCCQRQQEQYQICDNELLFPHSDFSVNLVYSIDLTSRAACQDESIITIAYVLFDDYNYLAVS